MTSNYWSQWDKSDLDSWQGIEPPEDDDDDDDYEEEWPDDDEAAECPCGYYCFDCLGLSWRDFY